MIAASGLARTFRVGRRTIEAVRGVDLRVRRGELVAFLGPNGAGKSTTLRMLTTLLPPTSGRAHVAGRDVVDDPSGVRARIGYVGQRHGAGEAFLVRDELVTQGRMHGMLPAQARRRAGELIERLDLAPFADRRPGTLSGGQRRRVDVALGLVNRPPLLFLDEPTAGLDPRSRARIRELVRELRERDGTTVVLTTHDLEEADRIAERVVVIDAGRIIADGTSDGLRAELACDRLEISTRSRADAVVAAEVGARLGTTGAVRIADTSVQVPVSCAATALPGYLRALEESGVRAVAAAGVRPTLDDVFLTLTGRSLHDEVLHGERS